MAQDPGRAFLNQQIQDYGFDFLDSYLDNVISRPKEESVYELLKTPGRKKTAQKRTRSNIANKAHIDSTTITLLEDDVMEKENLAPVNNFHKALLEAKEQSEDVGKESSDREYQCPENMPAPEDPQMDRVPDEVNTRVAEDKSFILEVLEVDDAIEPIPLSQHDHDAPIAVHAQELSVIAEDEEDHSRISLHPPVLDREATVDVTVPVRYAEVSPATTLTRKPSVSQFTGLSAPSPLRKSMKSTREPSGMLALPLTQTPGTGLGGKRTSWLTKAKEVRALEMTSGSGKKTDPVGEAAAASNKKRKSGDMLGPGDSNVDDEWERKQKSAKFLQTTQDSIASVQSPSESQPDLKPPEDPASAPKTLTAQGSSSYSSMDDFTVPLADVSEDEGALDRLKRTVEGFGARSKSMGKSSGGTAAAALAEARAAAQARVAERNKEAGTGDEELVALSPHLKNIASSEAFVPTAAAFSHERRLSVSELVSATEDKAKILNTSFLGHTSNDTADASVSTTPPDSPRQSARLSQVPPTRPPPVFSKPPPVFVAQPPVVAPQQATKDFSFKLPPSHPFSIPPAMALGVNSSLAPLTSPKSQPLSAQSSKASTFSDPIFDKVHSVPAWAPVIQDTESLYHPQYEQDERDDALFDEDSWHVDDKLKTNQAWTPFGFAAVDRDDTMTWTTATSRSASQKGDTDRFQAAHNMTDTLQHGGDPRERGPFDFLPEDSAGEAQAEEDMADMSMDIDDDSPGQLDSELEDIAYTGKSTISLVKPQEKARSQSQQSLASTSSSQSQQLGFFGQATKLMTSVLGGAKKIKPEPVKSIQRAAVVAKKQQEEAEKKVTRLRDMEQRRQQALQRKAEEEKVRMQEEEKRMKEEMEKRKRDREDLTDKRPLRSTTRKVVEDDTAKKRKLIVEPEKKPETSKKPPSRDQPSRLGKAPTSIMKVGPPLRSTSKRFATVDVVAGPSSNEPVHKTIKTVASFGALQNTSSIKGKGKTADMDEIVQPTQFVQAQMANRAKAQIQAAQTASIPPRVASESIELPEINSEYSDSEDEDRPRKFDPPNWAQSPELHQALQQQSTLNPDDIFGRIGPLRMEEIFRTRSSRFRARTSSANWSGPDQLTAEEEKAYEKRMGYQ